MSATGSNIPPATATDGQSLPLVWVLLGHRAGDNGQALALASALNWQTIAKRLRYTRLHHAPNWLIGASTAHLRRDSDPIQPPWPDIVIGVGKRSVPVARWIRRQSQSKTKLVQIGRPFAPLHDFDLIITTPQYGLPERPNVQHNLLPLNRPDPAKLAEAAEEWAPRLASLPRPWTGVLVGGSSPPFSFDVTAGTALGRVTAELAATIGGSLLVTTSPRTSETAAAAMADAIEKSGTNHFLHRWRPDAKNPYLAFLALAERFIVTADSASMLAEAASTCRPTAVFLPPDYRLTEFRAPGRLWCYLADAGLATPPRNLGRLQAAVRQEAKQQQGEEVATMPFFTLRRDDLARTVDRVKDLLLRPDLDYMSNNSPDSAPQEAAG